LWKVWKTLLKPIFKFVNKKYEKLPEDQKKNIEKAKSGVKEKFWKIKTFFNEVWTPPSQRKSNTKVTEDKKEEDIKATENTKATENEKKEKDTETTEIKKEEKNTKKES
jgi:hypothetical protein